MSNTLKVVAVSGSVQRPTRTLVLLKELVAGLAQQLPIELRLIELSEVGPKFAGVLRREDLPAAVEADLRAIETADLLIAASPVYRAFERIERAVESAVLSLNSTVQPDASAA